MRTHQNKVYSSSIRQVILLMEAIALRHFLEPDFGSEGWGFESLQARHWLQMTYAEFVVHSKMLFAICLPLLRRNVNQAATECRVLLHSIRPPIEYY